MSSRPALFDIRKAKAPRGEVKKQPSIIQQVMTAVQVRPYIRPFLIIDYNQPIPKPYETGRNRYLVSSCLFCH